jgi:hypothetical protein
MRVDPSIPPHAFARLFWYPTSRGGRRTPAGPFQLTYPVSIDQHEQLNDCTFMLDIRFFAIEMLPAPLAVGQRLYLREGARLIGEASVERVVS